MCEALDKAEKRGIELGETVMLVKLVCKKLVKGKSISHIAYELEEDEAVIEQICKAASQCVLEYDIKKIAGQLLLENEQ